MSMPEPSLSKPEPSLTWPGHELRGLFSAPGHILAPFRLDYSCFVAFSTKILSRAI